MLLNILPYTGQPSQQRMIWSKVSMAPRLRNLDLEDREDLVAMGKHSSREKEVLIQTVARQHCRMSRGALVPIFIPQAASSCSPP